MNAPGRETPGREIGQNDRKAVGLFARNRVTKPRRTVRFTGGVTTGRSDPSLLRRLPGERDGMRGRGF